MKYILNYKCECGKEINIPSKTKGNNNEGKNYVKKHSYKCFRLGGKKMLLGLKCKLVKTIKKIN